MQENEIDVIDVQEKGLVGKIKDWSYGNWQTILIILIVLIVGVSTYNYNQQGEDTAENSEAVALLDDESEEDNSENSDSNEEEKKENNNDEQGESSIESSDQEAEIENADEEEAEVEDEEEEKEEVINDKEEKEETISSTSNASGKTYTITTTYGEGVTHLARHALGKYLEELNNGSELTEEHKVYIEDYLQNKTGDQGLEIGYQETFSEDLILEAISNANKLSPKSLENLSKYTKNIGQ